MNEWRQRDSFRKEDRWGRDEEGKGEWEKEKEKEKGRDEEGNEK